MKNYQNRDKFFYVAPTLFPDWPYKSRFALGMKFSDFTASKAKVYRFRVGEVMYEIDSDKAKQLGTKYKMNRGTLPNIIPLEEFIAINLSSMPIPELLNARLPQSKEPAKLL